MRMAVGPILLVAVSALVLSAAAAGCQGADRDSSLVAMEAGASPAFAADTAGGAPAGCVNLECRRPACGPGEKTTITGIVHDPAGKIPLYNVIVYVPNAPLKPLEEGVSCDRCGAVVSGNAIATGLTDANGQFFLENVPAGENIPLVMQVGKWRRQVTIPAVTKCTNTSITDVELTRLPRNQKEGDIPRFALATGGADPLECLARKIGLDDTEFTAEGGSGRVHLFAGYRGLNTDPAAHRFDAAHGGASFTEASALWADPARLRKYDLVLLACEGDTFLQTKPAHARQAIFDYASAGGRVFTSHFHYTWISDGPSPFPFTGTWTSRMAPPDPVVGIVDATFPKGAAFGQWLVNAGASTNPGELIIREARHDIDAVDTTRAQRWITAENPNALDRLGKPMQSVEYMSFNTPVDVPSDQQCGRVVFSDLHVSSGDAPGADFPAGCTATNLSPQEKALVFMLFDLSSCIQRDDTAPKPPPIK